MEVGKVSQGRQTSLEINIRQNDLSIDKGNFTQGNLSSSESKDIKEVDIKKSVDKLNKFLEDEKVHAEYEVHDKLKDVMIKIVNDETKEVIMEIPPKKILDMVAKMCEMVGVLVDKKA